MFKFTDRAARLNLALAAIAGLATIASTTVVHAQEEAQSGELEEIVVTGSRIANSNLTQSSPVAVISAENIELRQVLVVEEFLREIPGVVPSIGASVNNGNGGSTFVNLRGLGSNRNITLLNGTRVVPADLVGRTNLDIIPVALLENVDVLTGGAGSAYGADAISGVINFKTRTDFEGIDVRVSRADTFEGGGDSTRFDLTLGGNFAEDRGNAVFSIGYTDRSVLTQGEREFAEFNISSVTGNPGGSSTSVPTRFVIPGATTENLEAAVPGIGDGTFVQINPDTGVLEPFFQNFNFNPFNLFQLPLEQYRAFGQANFKINEKVEWYSEMLFAQSTNITNLAPSGSFGFSAETPLSNPFIPDAVRNQICTALAIATADCDAAALATDPSDPDYLAPNINYARRFVELGPRTNERQTTVWQFKTGARGDITDTLSWDVFYATGQSDLRFQQGGNGTRTRLTQAVQATNTETCLDPSGGCIPIDLWGPLGSITPEVGAFLDVGNGGATATQLDQLQAFVSGDLPFALPTADDAPISGVLGYEYRNYEGGLTNELLTQTPGEVLGNGAAAPNRFGTFDVNEFFFEANVPVLRGMRFAEELTLQAGFRSSDYSTTGVEDTWKIGGTWSPVEGGSIQFRGNAQRVTRAPNISELFNPQVTGLNNFSADPCAGAAPNNNPDLQAICLAQGAPANTIGGIIVDPAGQVNVTTGGNLNLDAEEADTFTIGFIFQPEFVPGLSLTADYYEIRVENAITNPTPDDVFSACFGSGFASGNLSISAASASDPACTGIRRNPETGNLFGNVATTFGLPLVLTNQGTLETRGMDFTALYTFELGSYGSLNYNGSLNWTEASLFQASPNGINRECVGFYSTNCGSIQPEITANQRLTWQTNAFEIPLDVSLLWRYIGEMELEPGAGTFQPQFTSMDAANYFDLTARTSITDNFEVTLAIQNIADREPDIVGSNIGTTAFNTGNVYPSTYDPLGRRYSLTLRYRM
ncbi:MAG: TonB-dependent receptor [Pseudomonadota bacterium]